MKIGEFISKGLKKFRLNGKILGEFQKILERMWSKFRSITNNYFEKYKNKSLNKKKLKLLKSKKNL